MDVTQTAYLTLAARALEHRRPDSIFRDQTASDWHIQLGGLSDHLDPQLVNGIVLRTILFDYAVLAFLAAHPQGLVFDLGCGFSTRLYRLNPQGQFSWFHVDTPEIMQARDKLESPFGHRLEMNLTADFRTSNWLGFTRVSGDALMVCEGLLSYLELPEAINLIDYLRRRCPGSTVLGTAAQSTFGPHLWSVRDVAELEDRLGLHIVRSWQLGIVAHRLMLADPALAGDGVPLPVEGLIFEGLLL